MDLSFIIEHSNLANTLMIENTPVHQLNLDQTSIDDIINDNISNINAAVPELIFVSTETFEDKDGQVHLVTLQYGAPTVDDLIKLSGGINSDVDRSAISVLNFGTIDCTYFVNPIQFILVREIFMHYFNVNFFVPEALRDTIVNSYYNFLPDKYKKNYKPEECTVSFSVCISKSNYEVVYIFNLEAALVLQLDINGEHIIHAYSTTMTPKSRKDGIKIPVEVNLVPKGILENDQNKGEDK